MTQKKSPQKFKELVQTNQSKIWLYALLVVTILGVFNRVVFLYIPMRYDESYTFLIYASRPLQYVIAYYDVPNNHVFHTLLVYGAYNILGDHPWVIRLPALIAGILLVPASYWTASILFNKYAALLSAGLIASSSILIQYSTDARGYTLVCLFFLLILGMGAYLKNKNNRKIWLLFIIVSTLGFYTIPIMVYPFGIVVLWLLLSGIVNDTASEHWVQFIKNLIFVVVVTIVLTIELYLPILVMSGVDAVTNNRFVRSVTWDKFVTEIPQSLQLVWTLWNRDIPTVGTICLVFGLLIVIIYHKKISKHRIPIWFTIVILCVPIVLIQRVVPFARVWLFLLPVYIIMASAGITWCLGRVRLKISRYRTILYSLGVLLLSLMLSFNVLYEQSIYYSIETGTLRDAEKITLFLKNYLEPNDTILVENPSDLPLMYYFKQNNIPADYINYDLQTSPSGDRILIVVNNAHGQTLDGLLDKTEINLDLVELLHQYESATLYIAHR